MKADKLHRRHLKRQAQAQPRHFQQQRTTEQDWHHQFAYWLFVEFPQYSARPWESKSCRIRRDDRLALFRRRDWRWHLGYMKARRHGEGQNYPLD